MEVEWKLSLNRADVRVSLYFGDRANVTPDDLRALANAMERVAGLLDAIRHQPAAVAAASAAAAGKHP